MTEADEQKTEDLVTILWEMTERIIELKEENAALKNHFWAIAEQHEEVQEHVEAMSAVVEVVAEQTGLSPEQVAERCRANAISASNPDYAQSIPDNAAEANRGTHATHPSNASANLELLKRQQKANEAARVKAYSNWINEQTASPYFKTNGAG